MMRWDVMHYCKILPCFHIWSTHETEDEAKKTANHLMWTRKSTCCFYYPVPKYEEAKG